MRVRVGWSGETETNTWNKVDVELEEEDLARLLRENDLPEDLSSRLPVKACFQLMQNEAEALMLSKLRVQGYPAAKVNARIAVLIGSSTAIVTSIKEQLLASSGTS